MGVHRIIIENWLKSLDQGESFTFAVPRQALSFWGESEWSGYVFSLVRKKLLSIDTSKSPELSRQVLWNLHQIPRRVEFLDLDISLKSHCRKLYDIEGKELCTDVEECHKPRVINDILPRLDGFFGPFSRAVQYTRFLVFQLISSLIDRWVDFWNNMAEARLAWQSSTTAFREVLNRNLRFKPFLIPLRLIPRSIHPIESAA